MSNERLTYSPQRGKVRITEILLKEVTGAKDLNQVKSLNFQARLSNNNSNTSKIEKIEGLERVPNVQELNISFNNIIKIENIQHLVYLKELNLSENAITHLSGIESLKNLEILNLNGNCISELPRNVLKQLGKLRVLKLVRNRIKQYEEISNLSELKSLESLSISENPFCKLITYSEFCFIQLKALKVIDSKKIDEGMRSNAAKLFGDGKVAILNNNHEDNEIEKYDLYSAKERIAFYREENESLSLQLQEVNERLQKRVKEHSLAIEKIGRLEAELQAIKFDSMFEPIKDSRKLDMSKILAIQNPVDESQSQDNQQFEELLAQSKELQDKSDEYRFKIDNLESQCQRLKERISEREKEMNEQAEQYLQYRNQLKSSLHNSKDSRNHSAYETDELEKQIKIKEQKLAFHSSEADKLKCLNIEMQRDLEITREKIDKTRILINKLNAITEGESASSDVEDEREVLDRKITALYNKLQIYQEKSDDLLQHLSRVEDTRSMVSEEIEEMLQQRQESYMRVQKTVKTNESDNPENEKLKEMSNAIAFSQNEISILQDKYRENLKLLKELRVLLEQNEIEQDTVQSQLLKQQNSIKTNHLALGIADQFKKQLQQQLQTTISQLQSILQLLQHRGSKLINKKLASINRIQQEVNELLNDPDVEGVQQVIGQIANVLRFIFEHLEDMKEESGIILDERTKAKKKELSAVQQQIEDSREEQARFNKQIKQLIKSSKGFANLGTDKENEVNLSNYNNNSFGEGDTSGNNLDPVGETTKAFDQLRAIMSKVEKGQNNIKNFNEVKEKFLTDFERETQDLGKKWKDLDAKKKKHKEKLKFHKEELFKQAEQEGIKIQIEREELIGEWEKVKSEQKRLAMEAGKLKNKEIDLLGIIERENREGKENRDNLEQELYQLKAHLSRLQDAADEAEVKKQLAEKDLNKVLSQLQREQDKLQERSDLKEKTAREKLFLEEEIERLRMEWEQQAQTNSNLDRQKGELTREINKLEQDMRMYYFINISLHDQPFRIIDKFEREESLSKRKQKELEDKFNEKKKMLSQVEDKLSEKEVTLNRMESLTSEYNTAKEKYKQRQKECVEIEKLLEDARLKLEESEMKINIQQNQLASLKKQLDSVSKMLNEKGSSLTDIERKIQQGQIVLDQLDDQNQVSSNLLKKNNDEIIKIGNALNEKKREYDIVVRNIQDKQEKLNDFERQIDKVRNEYNNKSKSVSEMHKQYQLDESKFKQLMEENHNTLLTLRQNIEKRDAQLNELSKNLEQKQQQLSDTNSLIGQAKEEFNSLQQELTQKDEIHQQIVELHQTCQQMEEETIKLEERRNELDDEVTDLESYLEQLKEEQSQIIERVKALLQSEDRVFVQKGLKGEELDEREKERVEQIVEVFYQNHEKEQLLSEQGSKIEQLLEENQSLKGILEEVSNQNVQRDNEIHDEHQVRQAQKQLKQNHQQNQKNIMQEYQPQIPQQPAKNISQQLSIQNQPRQKKLPISNQYEQQQPKQQQFQQISDHQEEFNENSSHSTSKFQLENKNSSNSRQNQREYQPSTAQMQQGGLSRQKFEQQMQEQQYQYQQLNRGQQEQDFQNNNINSEQIDEDDELLTNNINIQDQQIQRPMFSINKQIPPFFKQPKSEQNNPKRQKSISVDQIVQDLDEANKQLFGIHHADHEINEEEENDQGARDLFGQQSSPPELQNEFQQQQQHEYHDENYEEQEDEDQDYDQFM